MVYILDYVGELLLSKAQSAIFQLYHDENKLHFDKMMTMFTLYQQGYFYFYSANLLK